MDSVEPVCETYANGDKPWYLNNKPHLADDGPAVENTNSAKSWYLNGNNLTKEEFIAQSKKQD